MQQSSFFRNCRAIRRHKMHPQLDQERFPVLFCGMPKPVSPILVAHQVFGVRFLFRRNSLILIRTQLDSAPVKLDPKAQCMRGTPVSQGRVAGTARVVHDFLTESHLIQEGEILITRATDTGRQIQIFGADEKTLFSTRSFHLKRMKSRLTQRAISIQGWTPYFPLLKGVVTEVGGLLSHGAVVAREYGLPAVVGVFGASDVIKSGDMVVLDGNSGLLTITQ